MAETAQTLDCDYLASGDVHLAHAVEDCDTGAEEWGGVGRVDIVRDTDCGFGAQDAVFSN